MIPLSSLLLSAALSGSLTVAQTPASPASVPLGATRVPMLTLTLQASCAAPVKVQTITVHHKGIGATDDISRLYLLDGTKRLSRTAVLQKQSAFAVIRPAGLTIDACTTTTITVAADLAASATAGGEHSIVLVKSADVQADASVSLKTAATSVTSTVPQSAGSITYAEVPTSSRNVLFGKQRTLLRFSLKAATKDQSVSAITFTNDGSARGTDLQHLAIYTANGQRVSAVTASLEDDLLRVTFDPALLLQKNASKLLTIRGDVTASRKRTIDLTLKEPGDIEASSVTRR